MRSKGIVGDGHAGHQLGIGLQRRGYAVTVVIGRTPDDVRDGRVVSNSGNVAHRRGWGSVSRSSFLLALDRTWGDR